MAFSAPWQWPARPASANAAEPVTQTLELPTLTADLATQVAQSADATQAMAADYQLQAERDAAAEQAAKQAEKDLAEAKKEDGGARRPPPRPRARPRRSVPHATASGPPSRPTRPPPRRRTTAPATGSVGTVIAFLKAQLGDAYVMGATGPNAWDCSSLVQAAFKQVGVDLPRVSQDQSMQGTEVSLSNLQVGDILYWGAKGSAYHVGVYVGERPVPRRGEPLQGCRHPGPFRLPGDGCGARALRPRIRAVAQALSRGPLSR